ncbi:MAG: class I SAM-dependent methyltransferase [Verrucomicrobiota bacterium]
MYIDKQYGPCAPEKNWVPAPQYLLRRARILRFFDKQKPGKVLEVGCGAGALLIDLQQRGFDCKALEISPEAHAFASWMTSDFPGIGICSEPQPDWEQRFDILIACEVIEHIEDDKAAVQDWLRYLVPGGRVVISVPAHPERWDAMDEWAGHYRRYTRDSMTTLFKACGLDDIEIECYAYPYTNIIAPLRSVVYKRMHRQDIKANEASDLQAQTQKSGISRSLNTKLFQLQRTWPAKWVMSLLYGWQARHVTKDIGSCYVAFARKT